MAEEEVNYASVVFKTNKKSPPKAEKGEETVYDEVKVQSEPTEQNGDTHKILQNKKENKRCCSYQHLACCLGILCVISLSAIVAVCVYLTTLSPESEQTQLTTLMADNQNLTNIYHNLSSDIENLRSDHNNLTGMFDNLTRAYRVLEFKTANLTAEIQNLETRNQNLTADNQNLKTQNQNLEMQRDNLTEKLKDMETEWNELNVSRAQWSIDAYCRQHGRGQCQPCRGGWSHSLYSCYAINNPPSAGQKTWTEARENCKGKISDLAVIVNEQEKTFIKENSWDSSGNRGYWIGLRVEDGKWKWADGSDLNETSWVPPPTNGHCAISVEDAGWNSVSCSDRNRWVCQQKALSV